MEAIEISKRVNQFTREHGKKIKIVALAKQGDDFVFDENLVVDVVGIPINDDKIETPVVAIMTKKLEEELTDKDPSEIQTIRDQLCN